MSREHILHRIRTSIGRSAGQPGADPPPVRLRIPEVDTETRMRIGARGGSLKTPLTDLRGSVNVNVLRRRGQT